MTTRGFSFMCASELRLLRSQKQSVFASKTATLPLGLICGSPSFVAEPSKQGVPSASALSSSSPIAGVNSTTTNSFYMIRPVIIAAFIFLALVPASAQSPAQTCGDPNASPDQAIAACTKLITSGAVTGNNLAITYG